MAASLTTLQFSSPYLKTQHSYTKRFNLKYPSIPKSNVGISRRCSMKCSYSNGRKPDSSSEEKSGKSEEMLREEKRRAELSARIASGEFTVEKPSFGSLLLSSLIKLGVPTEFVESLSQWINADENHPKVPEAKGAISAIRSEAFFIPLYELFLTYGGIFRLTFGPKSFLIVSDPNIAKRILKDNSKAYSKGILAEILEFVMGTGLIPADGEVWRVRRRVIVPALHQKYVAAMIGLFGRATDRLCKKLDAAAYNGEDVEMESLFSRLTLDIIGKAVFNYDFDSLTTDNGIVEIRQYTQFCERQRIEVSHLFQHGRFLYGKISHRGRRRSMNPLS